MTEYSLAPIMLTFLLGLTKITITLFALYIPIHLLARAFSLRNIIN